MTAQKISISEAQSIEAPDAAIAAKMLADEAEDRRLERMTHDELCQVEAEILASAPEIAA